MKKLSALLLLIFMTLALCACGSQDSGGGAIDLPHNGKKGPSSDMLQEDIVNALSEKNPHATLTEAETVKSLTEDGKYDITLNISAETKYADWNYQIALSYTKYDQGWMLDRTTWNSCVYEPIYPEASVLMDYIVNNYYDEIYQLEYLLPADTYWLDNTYSSETQQILFCWSKEKARKHGVYTETVRTYWHYDPDTDNWVLLESDENEAVCGYALFRDAGPLEILVNFSGTWSGYGGEFTISNYTVDSFDLQWDNFSSHFTISETTSI